jgi:hypothetical protein
MPREKTNADEASWQSSPEAFDCIHQTCKVVLMFCLMEGKEAVEFPSLPAIENES